MPASTASASIAAISPGVNVVLADAARFSSSCRTLLALRRTYAELSDPRLDRVRADYDEDARWLLVTRGPFRIAANFGGAPVSIAFSSPQPTERFPLLLAASDPGITLKSDAISLPPASLAVIDPRPG